MKEKIIFFGAGPYVVSVIEILNRALDLSLVITTEEENKGPVYDYCRESNIEVYSISQFSQDVINTLLDENVKVAVLASFGLIIPQKVLDIFPLGIVNIHPSLLPKYRGTTPVQTALLNGDKTTGVSIIRLDNEMDHGPLIAAADCAISEGDTAESLYPKLFKLGADLLVDALPKYISGNIIPAEQNHSKATFTKPLTRNSGFIDIDNLPKAEIIKRMVRAYSPWPGVWFKTNLNGKGKTVKLLPQNMAQVEGKNPMLMRDLANGYPEGRQILNKLGLNG